MFLRTLSIAALLALPGGIALAESHESEEMASAEMEITGDAEAGERVFRKCMACHAVGEDAKNKVGPILNGSVGRDVATVEGFNYSDAMVEWGEGQQWTPEILAGFLEDPRGTVKGTKMAFAGLRKEEERTNVIAYLAQFDETGATEEGS